MRKLLYSLGILFIFISCRTNTTRYSLDNQVYWATANNTVEVTDAKNLNYKQLTDFDSKNLQRLVGTKGAIVWLRIDFKIPDKLRYNSLGLVIPYLHFADIAYLNGEYIGSYGKFPPNEYSAQYVSHFYNLSVENLNQTGINTVLIKVWAFGNSSLSNGIFIDRFEEAKNQADIFDFLHSEIYMLFEGGLLIAFALFMLLGLSSEHHGKAYRIFAEMNFVTMIFLAYFFGAEIPWYQQLKIPGYILTKYVLCIPLYIIIFFLVSFIIHYLEIKEQRSVFITRIVLFIVPVVITLFAPSYYSLMRICPYMLFLIFAQFGIGVYILIKTYKNPETKLQSLKVFMGFLPLLITILFDFLVRYIMLNTEYSFFAIYGWIATILVFVFYLTHDYKNNSQQILYLSKHLEEEVKLKTTDLIVINEKLEHQISNSTRDMEMAAIVQRKFYPQNENFFDGWELSVCFDPMSKISGDLYDYYSTGTTLNGLGLFDASGHGVAASLVCMLAKSIIFRAFVQGKASNETMAVILERINEHLIEDKGEVTNYLTGVLIRFSEFDVDGKCLLELSSAGHPYPIFYSAETDEMITITHDEYQEQYGALGIKGMDVSFPNVDITICEGDILVLYTDGVTEAMNKNGEEFGSARLSKIVYENRKLNSKQIQEAIMRELTKYTTGVERTDDITFVVLRRVPRWEK